MAPFHQEVSLRSFHCVASVDFRSLVYLLQGSRRADLFTALHVCHAMSHSHIFAADITRAQNALRALATCRNVAHLWKALCCPSSGLLLGSPHTFFISLAICDENYLSTHLSHLLDLSSLKPELVFLSLCIPSIS